MGTLLHWDPGTLAPGLTEWVEEPFTTLRPQLASLIRIEDYVEADHYLVRAELAGVDPGKDVEVTVGAGQLTIRAVRHDKTEGKHRTGSRCGSFSRCVPLPANADEENVKAAYSDGILTVSVGLKAGQKEAVRKIEITGAG
jgi:HSP20 family molecular chaperone IbpA